MRLALCNEVLRDRPFAAQCVYAAALGYDGLEVAPFTLGSDPLRLPAGAIAAARDAAAAAGIAITGLHWLLVAPPGLSITATDPALRARTTEVMRHMVGLCAELGGRYLVHGSPAQRRIPPDTSAAEARARAMDALATAAEAAAKAGVVYCIEPLARNETDLVNTVAEAAAMVREIGHPALRTMIDTSAAAQTESVPVAELVRAWMPSGLIAHVQVNDRNRKGPGQGDDRFAPVFAALRDTGYDADVGVEPFIYEPDGPGCAARSVGYLRGILETL